MVREEKEILDMKEGKVSVIDLNKAGDNNVEAARVLRNDPLFIEALECLKDIPMDLPTRTWSPTTAHFHAMLAVQQ